jgi:hypothetical protein
MLKFYRFQCSPENEKEIFKNLKGTKYLLAHFTVTPDIKYYALYEEDEKKFELFSRGKIESLVAIDKQVIKKLLASESDNNVIVTGDRQLHIDLNRED